MKKASVLFFAAAVCAATIPVAAQDVYYGDYAWLRFWNVKEIKTPMGVGQNGAYWQKVGWVGTRPDGKAGGDFGVDDQMYELWWNEPMDISSVRVEGFIHNSPPGAIGEYYLQYTTVENPGKNDWITVSTPTSLTGVSDYNITGLDIKNALAIRVLFPEGNYNYSGGNANGPGIAKLLPTGKPSSGSGFDVSNPLFDIMGTLDKANPENNLFGINPTIDFVGDKATYGSNVKTDFFDNNLRTTAPYRGWLTANVDCSSTIICDLGVSLDIHNVWLYGGGITNYTGAAYMDVYVTDDLATLMDDLAQWRADVAEALLTGEPTPDRPDGFVITAERKYGSLTTLTYDAQGNPLPLAAFDAVGRYVVWTNPSGVTDNLLLMHMGVNATLPVPEPATMTLLAMGGLAMLRRRK